MASLNHFLFWLSFFVTIVASVCVLFCVFPAYQRSHNRAFLYFAFTFLLYILDAVADHTLAFWRAPHEQHFAYLVLRGVAHITAVVLLATGVISITRTSASPTDKP